MLMSMGSMGAFVVKLTVGLPCGTQNHYSKRTTIAR